MQISAMNPKALSREQITHLLFGNQPYSGESADCIFVFGGALPDRVSKGVELYKAGKASRILFTGGTKFGQKSVPEAVLMRDLALSAGVPEADILLECDSNHTVENVLASLLVLHREVGLHKIRRLLAVSAPYHMRRSMLALRTYMPSWIQFIWCPPLRPGYEAGDWWQTPAGVSRITSEATKVVNYVRNGFIEDEDVTL